LPTYRRFFVQLAHAQLRSQKFASLTLPTGLQGALLWGMNEVAHSAGEHQLTQTARPEPSAPALATLTAPREITLAPVTIVARRVTEASTSNLALTEKMAAPLSPTCVRVAAETTSVEKDGRNCG
jgi:hypothetical protein